MSSGRVKPEEKAAVEERTRKWRERGHGTSVIYKLGCTVQHAGIGGTLTGLRDGEVSIRVLAPGGVQHSTWFEVTEDRLESLIEFLRFAKEEILTLRENYERIEDTTE